MARHVVHESYQSHQRRESRKIKLLLVFGFGILVPGIVLISLLNQDLNMSGVEGSFPFFALLSFLITWGLVFRKPIMRLIK